MLLLDARVCHINCGIFIKLNIATASCLAYHVLAKMTNPLYIIIVAFSSKNYPQWLRHFEQNWKIQTIGIVWRIFDNNHFLGFLFDLCIMPLPSKRLSKFFSVPELLRECLRISSWCDGLLCTMANDLLGWWSWNTCEFWKTANISGAKNGTFVWICR